MAEVPEIQKCFSKSQFAALTFFAQSHANEVCGSNGLPLTPNSVTIYGRAQYLKTIKHINLCSYLDFIRGKHERTVVVSEHQPRSLKNVQFTSIDIVKIAYQVLTSLSHLNRHGIVHRNLCPENILFSEDNNIQLFNYGLYYMTGCGLNVSFPIGHPKYMAPEVYLSGANIKSGPKVDVWSLGVIIAELSLEKQFWPHLKLHQCIKEVISLLHCTDFIPEYLAKQHECFHKWENMSLEIRDFINCCLKLSPKDRPTPEELLKHSLFSNTDLDFEHSKLNNDNLLTGQKLQDLYYLWQLAGGDVHSELKKKGLIRSKAPVLSLCNLVLLEGQVFGQVRDQASMLDLRVIPLSLKHLYKRLAHIPPQCYYPLVEIKSDIIETEEHLDAATLPLVIREKDTEYQFHRILLYDRLLQGYPYKKSSILREARKDIPPLYRSKIWAALLDIVGDIEQQYVAIDKETPTHTDRQIEVDIPRCHQYDELLSSSEGHRKFKRVLKAWVVSHPQYVYWQGLDSLCAPFLYLNFNNESQAYACIKSFIPKYLHNFFLKDNSLVIQEYLSKFSHLIAFHDPSLANHLASIAFIPELFAIPWFLTMFSHVFPLHKIFHLWDKLLLGDTSFPLFVGLAILQQLRDTLLDSGFNECILLFSNLPEIDIERCVTDSINLYCSTPRSATYRQHELKNGVTAERQDLNMSPVTVAELQAEFCPRISAADLLELLDVKQSKYSRPKVIVIDIRLPEDYQRGAIPGSINIPFNSDPRTVDLLLVRHKGKIMVVADSGRGSQAAFFCRQLVEYEFPRVCFLHKGISVLRATNILVVPGAM